jgi:ATP-dependent helicase/nuclease subunit B
VEHGVQLQLLGYLASVRRWPPSVWSVLEKTVAAGLISASDPIVPAGVFYVNLRGHYDAGRTRDEVLSDADPQREAYRHTGRFDANILPRLDRTKKHDQFKYQMNQDGKLRAGSTEALPRPELEKLLDRVETQLETIGRAIFSGDARVNPYRKGTEIPCDRCDYLAVCRLDPWTHRYRVLRKAGAVAAEDS